MCYFILMMLGLIWMGLYPQSFLALSEPVLDGLLSSSSELLAALGRG